MDLDFFQHLAHGCDNPATACIATVALAFAGFGCRFPATIRRERPANIYLSLEFALLIPPNVSTIALVRFDQGSLARLASTAAFGRLAGRLGFRGRSLSCGFPARFSGCHGY